MENPVSEPMKVALGLFHGWLVTMKYPWNAFIGHERVSFHGLITKTDHACMYNP